MTHRKSKTAEYYIWQGMKRRCYNPNADNFKYYGGSGITVCDRWRKSFLAFLEDMGKRPTPQHTIDRKDTNGPYSPDNCRWATHAEQMKTRRLPANSIPSCVCGVCSKCRNRAAVARYAKRKKAS